MSKKVQPAASSAVAAAPAVTKNLKRIVLAQGGKGGVGKTGVIRDLTTWYRAKGLNPLLFDFDAENKLHAGLIHWVPEAKKYDVHKRGTLDEFFSAIENESDIVVADQGAGAGAVTQRWFTDYSSELAELGLRFTLLCIVDDHPSTVTSVLDWANAIGGAVDYVIAFNELSNPDSDFRYWNDSVHAKKFEELFKPAKIRIESRYDELEGLIANFGVTLADVATGTTTVPKLRELKYKMQAARYYRHLCEQFDSAAELLLP